MCHVFQGDRESWLSDYFFSALFGILKGEESEEVGVDAVGYPAEVLGAIAKLTGVPRDDEELTLVLGDPLLVLIVKPLEVVDTHV